MTGRYVIADTRIQVDLAWQQTCEKNYVDGGREPQPLDAKSFLLVSAFFLLTWGLSTWSGLAHFIPAIDTTTIVGFAGLRFHSFNQAYEEYLQQRRAALVRVGI